MSSQNSTKHKYYRYYVDMEIFLLWGYIDKIIGSEVNTSPA